MSANGVTDPGATPSTSASSAALPKLKRRAPSALANALRSIPVALSATTRNSSPRASFRNRFLVWPPGRSRSSSALGNREYGTVLGGARGDAELGEPIEQVLA